MAFAAVPAVPLLSACGSEDEEASSSKDKTITVTHKYGSTEIEGTPKKVVTLGLSDQDAVLALGIKPAGCVDWFKERPFGEWAWTKNKWGNDKPEIVGERDEYNTEKIAELEPDLIIAQYSGMKKEQYETLSELAPVVAQPKGYEDYQAPWQVMTRQIGKSLGKKSKAQQLIDDIDASFQQIRDEHPAWDGLTIAVGEPYEAGTYTAFSPEDPKVAFFTEMGFTTSKKYDDALGSETLVDLSYERIDVMDADRAVWLGTDDSLEELKSEALYQQTSVHQDGRDLFVPYYDPDIGAALSFSTVLSLQYAIDEVVPMLEEIK